MTRRFRAQPNRRIEAVNDDRDVIALARRDLFKHPVVLRRLACLTEMIVEFVEIACS
jgi:hypothetical protein